MWGIDVEQTKIDQFPHNTNIGSSNVLNEWIQFFSTKKKNTVISNTKHVFTRKPINYLSKPRH